MEVFLNQAAQGSSRSFQALQAHTKCTVMLRQLWVLSTCPGEGDEDPTHPVAVGQALLGLSCGTCTERPSQNLIPIQTLARQSSSFLALASTPPHDEHPLQVCHWSGVTALSSQHPTAALKQSHPSTAAALLLYTKPHPLSPYLY